MHHFVLQTTPRDCGWACLKMLLADVHHDDAYLTLAPVSTKGPLSFLDLVGMAAPLGLTLEGYKVTCKKEALKTQGSWVALLEIEGRSHYVIVDRVKRKTVLIRDPSSGSYAMDKETFLQTFSGNLLIVAGWEKPKKKITPPIGLPRKRRFFLYLWQSLSAFFLLAGLASINVESHFALPIALFAAYFVLELAYKASLLKAMVYLDKNYVVPKMNLVNKDIRSNLRMLYELKSTLIVTPLSLITHLMTVLAFIIILGLNGWNNLLLVVFVALALLLERFIYTPKEGKHAREIAVLEDRLVEGMSKARLETDVTQGLEGLNKQTYRYAMNDEIRKYIFYFALLAGVLLSMGLTGNVSLNYLVFHFMALAFLSENIRAMMDYSKKQDKMRLLINRYQGLK